MTLKASNRALSMLHKMAISDGLPVGNGCANPTER